MVVSGTGGLLVGEPAVSVVSWLTLATPLLTAIAMPPVSLYFAPVCTSKLDSWLLLLEFNHVTERMDSNGIR